MTQVVETSLTKIQELSSILLTTLDESIFFNELARFMKGEIQCDHVIVYKVLEDHTGIMVSRDGEIVDQSKGQIKAKGSAGHVIRTKRPYFSNQTDRDPVFADVSSEGVKAELAVPVSVDGIVIATIHFQSTSGEHSFARDHMTHVQHIFNNIGRPLANMKMYLQAKYLNEALMQKIEEKEKELAKSKSGPKVADSFKIAEKDIIGQSESMKKLIALVDRVSNSDVNALLQGEAGTGKEMIARRLHCRSHRRDHAFISIDVTSLSEEMLELELFGKEIIDFTQNHNAKKGLIEQAHGGTLFINNVDGLSANLQAKITHFIQEKMAFRVGGQVPYRADVRLIVASTRELSDLVEGGHMREDLYYALNTMIFNVPALRERHDDIEVLATHFLNLGKSRDQMKSLGPAALKALREYNWPGNVRELQNVMERAYILSDGMIVERDHLADSVSSPAPQIVEEQKEVYSFQEMTLDDLERKHITMTLEHLAGNKTKTAKVLGITVKTLYNKLHSYGMIISKEA